MNGEDLRRRLLKAEVRVAELSAGLGVGSAIDDRALVQGELRFLRSKLASAEHALAAERDELMRTRNSASFQLGKLLVACRRFSGIASFPAGLFAVLRSRGSGADHAARQQAPVARVSLSPCQPSFERRVIESRKWIAPQSLDNMRIAAVVDTFTATGLGAEAELLLLDPARWSEQLDAFKPHMLFVESAWNGNEGTWAGQISPVSDALASLVAGCRQLGVPTVFWNKEDPLHFDAFLPSAALFDYVFTTDLDCIARYTESLGHDRVGLLPFAAQPRADHPISSGTRNGRAFFAGAWYADLHQRNRDFEAVAGAAALSLPLDIFSRPGGALEGGYPEKWRDCVLDSVPYTQMPELHRRYSVGVNVSTIKQSPTMFARRAVELLASGTAIVSNYSLSMSSLFGTLVRHSDEPAELLSACDELASSVGSESEHEWRYRAVRHVLQHHTWGIRLERIARSLWPDRYPRHKPGEDVAVVASAADDEEARSVIASWRRQAYVCSRLYVRCPAAVVLPPDVVRLDPAVSAVRPADGLSEAWLAPFHTDDWYGEQYLHDLALGLTHGFGAIVGKAAYQTAVSADVLAWDRAYARVNALALRRALIPSRLWMSSLDALLDDIDAGAVAGDDLASLDAFSYLENARHGTLADAPHVPGTNTAPTADELEFMVGETRSGMRVPPSAVSQSLNAGTVPAGASATLMDGRVEICSKFEPAQVDAIIGAPIRIDALLEGETVRLESNDSEHVSVYVDALDADGELRARTALPPDTAVAVASPPGTESHRLAISVRGSGLSSIRGISVGDRAASPLPIPGRGRLLLLTGAYPAYDDLYQHAFVHARVRQYLQRGIAVDVVKVTAGKRRGYEFEGVPVLEASAEAVRATLRRSAHSAVLVHAMTPAIWTAVADDADRRPLHVWVHGAEMQAWQRRPWDLDDARVIESAERIEFWRRILSAPPAGMTLVFPSRSAAEDAWSDVGLQLDARRWTVIPNPIDTERFAYIPKADEQRHRVLSIRPHASPIYANDVSASVIEALASRRIFDRLQFDLYGDGPLWQENFARLARFSNVNLRRGFLRQQAIAGLHRHHGLFLVPTRGDTQGVSRDEAMASGLVPITNLAGAVGEFVDEECAIIASPGSIDEFVTGIERVACDPQLFQQMSASAAARVRRQSSAEIVIPRELQWIGARRQAPDEAGPRTAAPIQ